MKYTWVINFGFATLAAYCFYDWDPGYFKPGHFTSVCRRKTVKKTVNLFFYTDRIFLYWEMKHLWINKFRTLWFDFFSFYGEGVKNITTDLQSGGSIQSSRPGPLNTWGSNIYVWNVKEHRKSEWYNEHIN